MKKENIGSEDPQSLDNRRLSIIARNPDHPMHTHAKAELERRRMKTNEGAMKRIATTQASKTDRMASTDKKGLETFKKKPTSETKDAFGRLGITSPTMKHIDKKLDKVTQRTQTVMNKRPRSTMEEKTLTPAELKKREKIAKAIERDNPDMPMDKKMAIATATAKRVAESKDDEYHKTLGQTKNSDEGIAALKKKHGMSHTKAVATLKRLMGEQKVNEDKRSEIYHSHMSFHHAMKQAEYKNKNPELAKKHDQAGSLHAKVADMHADNHPDASKHGTKADKMSKALDEGKAYGPTGVSYYVPSGHKDEVNPKTGEKYPERQKPGYKNPSEQKVDELKKSTLASYIKKASDDRAKNAYDIGKSGKINYKGLKRRQGINRAVNKMANEEATIKELDKKTLGSYIKKAGPDREKQKAQAARHSDAGDMADKDRDMYKHYGKAQRAMDKAANRSKYIGKAVDKLTKEATIPDGQTAMTRVAKVSDADKEKLIKIRKMLDKEKKK